MSCQSPINGHAILKLPCFREQVETMDEFCDNLTPIAGRNDEAKRF